MASLDLIDSKGNKLEAGDAAFTKINDDVNVKPTTKLIGLTKEQLEVYRNDPFWKAVRYIAFALFWLIWLAMFVGAILIVVFSDKCVKTLKIDEKSVNYRILTQNFRDSDGDKVGDFKGIQEKLQYLKSIGVSHISPTPIFKTGSQFLPDTVVNLEVIDRRLGGESKFKELVDAAHDVEVGVIADIPLAVSAKSENVWSRGETRGESRILDVGNNIVASKLIEVVNRLVKLGVNGIRFTGYGSSISNSIANSVESLINRIRDNITNDQDISNKNLVIIVESDWGNDVNADFVESLLLRPSDNNSVPSSINNLVNKNLNTTKRLWKFTDTNQPPLGDLLPSEYRSKGNLEKATSVLQLIEFMLPGPVGVFYGGELGLLASSSAKMPWKKDGPNFGFSENDEVVLSQITAPSSAEQLLNTDSYLHVLKNVTKLRKSNRVLSNGSLVVDQNNDIYYYVRQLENDKNAKIYILVVNWPSRADNGKKAGTPLSIPPKLLQSRVHAKVIAHSFSASNFPSTPINLITDKLSLKPLEAVLLEVTA